MKYEKYVIIDGNKKLSGWRCLDWARDALYFYIQNGVTTARIVTIY